MYDDLIAELERKYCRLGEEISVSNGSEISGYASFFGKCDQSGDIVEPGAYHRSLEALGGAKQTVKMLWQHDPSQPIGVWDEVFEDSKGLFVKGRVLSDVAKGREALALIEAGAIDGLSIGYRTVKAQKNEKGQRLLTELELWEVSLVTFPMLPDARVGAKSENKGATDALLRELAATIECARQSLAKA